ncbi:hypothetical protein EDB83DRAFT_590465 [Lactarius deliciosus]|nr:hypothetical protein EDB83DRAFT_590465 [Lactarius deliciosus]
MTEGSHTYNCPNSRCPETHNFVVSMAKLARSVLRSVQPSRSNTRMPLPFSACTTRPASLTQLSSWLQVLVTQLTAMSLRFLIYQSSLCLLPHQRDLLSTILLWCCCMRWATLGLTSKDTPLVFVGENRNAKVDVCVFDVRQKGILHLVQENIRQMDHSDPEPQLVAKAISNFRCKSSNSPTKAQSAPS